MPTVTTTRWSPRQEPYYVIYNGVYYSLFQSQNVGITGGPASTRQTTTSFRTGGRWSEEGSVGVDEISGAGNTLASGTRSIASDYRKNRGNSKYDTGNPFLTSDEYFDGFSHPEWAPGVRMTRGLLSPILSGSGLNDLRNYTHVPAQPSLVVQGLKGIRDTLPTESPAALAQALIELKREGVPRVAGIIDSLLSKAGRDVAKGAGSAVLASEFGFKPLLRDLESAISTIQNGEELLRKYEEGAGKRQHRQRSWEPRVYTDSLTTYGYSPLQSTEVIRWSGHAASNYGLKDHRAVSCTTDRTVTISDKFKGAFTYHLPEMFKSPGAAGFAEKYRYLTGLDISPSLLWEVTPWSWLSDWVVNIGDNIAVAEALRSDSLVLVYGYMMRETRYQATRTLRGLTASDGSKLLPVTATYNKVVKERIRATPYGFGLNVAGFTGRQWAILGALGMTKGSNSLHRT